MMEWVKEKPHHTRMGDAHVQAVIHGL
jgi:hypothetical protein